MSFEAERAAIEGWFHDRWERFFAADAYWDGYPLGAPTVRADCRVAYDNVQFTAPTPDQDNPQETVWVRLTILPAGASQITLGDNPIRQHNGVISVQIFHPENAKANCIRRVADIVSAILDLQSIALTDVSGFVQCRRSNLRRIGPENGWYQVNVDTVYVRQNSAGVSGALSLAYGLVNEDLDDFVVGAGSPVGVTLASPARIVFPVTTEDHPRFWFEPPTGLAFGAVYNIAIERTLGTFDHTWVPFNPKDDMGAFNEDRVVFHSKRYHAGVVYIAAIHHLFEIEQ